MSNGNTETDAMNERQSQLATVLIGVLIVVAGFLIYTVFNNQTALETPDDLDVNEGVTPTTTEQPTDTEEPSTTPEGGSRYIVQEGDTLWSIAQQAYEDGYQWQSIAEANGIALDNTSLEVGQELDIPAIGGPEDEEPTPTVTPEEPTPTPEEPTPTEEQSDEEQPSDEDNEGEEEQDEDQNEQMDSAETYTVQRGDTLWSIAERFYGDGNQWETIFNYEENSIGMYTSRTTGEQYPIIHAGNVLVIPQIDNAA